MSARGTFGACVLAVVLCSVEGYAQSANELARRELLTQAEASANAGDHARAVELLERAGAIQWTPSHRLFIALEYERVGRLVQALDAATSCEREARADSALRNRAAIEQACSELATGLRARVARVVVRVPPDAPRATRVTVAGQPLAEALWGLSLPVAPGTIEVVTDGPGLRPTRTTVDAIAGRVTDVAITLDRVAPADPDPTTATQEPPRTTVEAPRSQPSQPPPNTTVSRDARVSERDTASAPVAPWVLVGVGGAVIVTGAALGGAHFAAAGAIESDCRQSTAASAATAGSAVLCVESGQQFDARIRGAELTGTLGVVALSVGASVAIGATLWGVLAPRSSARARAAYVAPVFDGRGGTLVIGGQL
ncbi:MAG: hypothetical protein JNK05_11165 [Myxococcales bacterium]|nr:hypothetical protein [Myxococcales bacterium]